MHDRHVPGALVEPMRKEFHLNDSQIGLIGSAFIWIYAIVGVPLGRIADSASRKSSWHGESSYDRHDGFRRPRHHLRDMLLSRVGVGVGEAACAPTATSWLGDLFPQARRSLVLALFMLGVPVGGALGFFFQRPDSTGVWLASRNGICGGAGGAAGSGFTVAPRPERGASGAIARR